MYNNLEFYATEIDNAALKSSEVCTEARQQESF